MSKIVPGNNFIDMAAQALGIEARLVRRIVVDAQIGDVLIVHVELYGDEDMLNVAQTLEGVKITRVAREASDAN
jgi:hypothetical protein